MIYSLLYHLLLISAALALVVGAKVDSPSKRVTYNFDNLVSPIGSGAPIEQIGKYKQLDFALRLGTRSNVTAIEGVVPHTPPNYAIFGNESTIVSGPATINKTASVASFDLESFWYGCELAIATSNINVPINCTIVVRGVNAKGKQVASRALKYVASGSVQSQPQMQARLMGFEGLSSVHFDYDSVDVLQTGVIFDNFVATLYEKRV